jgi:O-methyltransferase involved in polyketide biosynthesis
MALDPGRKDEGDVGVTALYTSHCWRWAALPRAELLSSFWSGLVFVLTNAVVGAVRLFFRRYPSLRHSLVQRHLMIDWLLRRSRSTQVLEIAAGLSRRGASFSDETELVYVEVDLPAMIELKRTALARTAAGREVLGRENLRLIAGDARTIDLSELVDRTRTLFVIAEGLVMYLDAEQQRALFRRVAEVIRVAKGGEGAFVFDLVPTVERPRIGWIDAMIIGLIKVATRGKFMEEDQRGREDVVADLAAAGFSRVEVLEPDRMPKECALPYLNRPTQVVMFHCRL